MAQPFSLNGTTTKVSPNGASANGAISMGGNTTVLVTNAGTVIAYVKSAATNATASASDTPVLSGTAQTFSISADHGSVAAYAASSCDVYFTVGSGT